MLIDRVEAADLALLGLFGYLVFEFVVVFEDGNSGDLFDLMQRLVIIRLGDIKGCTVFVYGLLLGFSHFLFAWLFVRVLVLLWRVILLLLTPVIDQLPALLALKFRLPLGLSVYLGGLGRVEISPSVGVSSLLVNDA